MIYTLIAQHSVGLPKGALCEITEVSRSGLYRFLSSVKEKVDSIEANLIEHIEHICVDMPGYGWLFRCNRPPIPIVIGHLPILSLSKLNIFQSVRLGKNIF